MLVSTFFCATLCAQPRHWQVANGEVFLWESFSKNAPALFFEPVEQPGIYPVGSFVVGQDSLGFLWLSGQSGGVLRHDGVSFKKIQAPGIQSFKGGGFAVEPAGNRLWLPLENGLGRYDLRTGKLTVFRNNLSPTDSTVASVFFDEKRKMLVVNFGEKAALKLCWFDPATGLFTRRLDGAARNAYTGTPLPPVGAFNEIAVDGDGRYWVCALFEKDNMLLSLDPASGEWLAFPFRQLRENGRPEAEPGNYHFLEILLDSDGRHIWASGFHGGLKCFDKLTRQWKQHMVNVPEHDFAANCIVDIAQWDKHTLLLATNLGMHLFDKRTGRFSNHQFFPVIAASHFSKTVSKITLDRDGNAWITSVTAGLYKLDPRKQFFRKPRHLPEHFAPFDFYRDTLRGKAWFVGTNYQNAAQQLLWVDEKTGQSGFLSAPPYLLNLQAIADWGSRIADWGGKSSIRNPKSEIGKSEILLAGSSSFGLWQIDLLKNRVTPIRQPIEGLPGITTDSLGETHLATDAEGNRWAASSRYGLLRCRPGEERWRLLYPRHAGDNLLKANKLKCIFFDKKGRLWLTANDRDAVLCLQNPLASPASWTVKSFAAAGGKSNFGSAWVSNFAETADGSIWVQGWRKLYRIGPGSDSLALVPGVEPTYGILTSDSGGNLWANAWGSLHCFHAASGRWKRFGKKDGYPQAPITEIMSGCVGDEIIFTPTASWRTGDLRFNEVLPQPVFTAMTVNEEPLETPVDLNFVREIRLEPGQNFFTVEFAALSYSNPEDNLFAYQLSGVDKDWVQCGSRHSAAFTGLRPGRYTFRLKAANNDGLWNERPAELRIYLAPFFYQTVWFKTLAGLAVLSLLYFLGKNRLKAAQREALLRQREAELKQQEAEFQRQLAEVEMSALRSQMNPHFIFNVLNSINRYTLDHDAETASNYLTKFARLVRLVLENSRNGNVTLESDLTALGLYIEMEALRFKEKVRWSIEVEADIDQKFIKIPPMLIQPYVENAIWHGLMHKKEGGTVAVRVSQPAENQLCVEVEDDGIGRAAAAALKSKSAVERKSFGMQITSQRLALVNKLYHTNLQAEVLDLVAADGGAAGTRVVLRVPV
ncbi:MAG: histidine kinase [Bacteroidetes bacterium]|nr:histidine kinase [Bacteroidota bacterium]